MHAHMHSRARTHTSFCCIPTHRYTPTPLHLYRDLPWSKERKCHLPVNTSILSVSGYHSPKRREEGPGAEFTCSFHDTRATLHPTVAQGVKWGDFRGNIDHCWHEISGECLHHFELMFHSFFPEVPCRKSQVVPIWQHTPFKRLIPSS